MIKKVRIEEAVGMVLGHEVVRITPGEGGALPFQRGYVVREEDIPRFLEIGKEHIYVVEGDEPDIHENEAALRIARATVGEGLRVDGGRGGGARLKAGATGVLKINVPLLDEINGLGDFAIGTRHNWTACREGESVAMVKIMPLYVPEAKLLSVENLCRDKGRILDVLPFRIQKAGAVITGSEVYKGRITDRFADVLARKVEPFGVSLAHAIIVPDDVEAIARAISELHAAGCEVIFACSGMSVDPDDVTMDGIRASGADVIMEGVPMMPSAILGLAMLRNVPVLGTPAGVLRGGITALDGVLPMIFAGMKPRVADIIAMGHGGFCLEKYAF
ncbi:MAG: molybdopterin-binding protein [Syntrophotalea sp.]|uniref:molybdopterin-binding protein n=1 Tax=Syntrophotalea sp. TaxID=2812029 RepID=UPI003D0A339C